MKMFRWLAAGVLVILIAALVLSRTGRVRVGPSSAPPAASEQSVAASALAAPSSKSVVPPVAAAAASTKAAVETLGTKPVAGSFENWADKFAGADAAQRAALLMEGEALARARHDEMAQLIRTNPEAAIQRALPYGVRQQLPANILALIEQAVSGHGQFRPLYYTPLKGRESEVPPTGYEVVMDRQRFETHTYGARLQQPAHDNTYLHGVSVDHLLALSDSPARIVRDPAEKKALLTAAITQGELRADPVCGTTDQRIARLDQMVVAQYGKGLRTFCQPAHAEQFNRMLQTAHGMLWASGGAAGSGGTRTKGAAKSSAPGDLPPGPGSSVQGLQKLLYIRVSFADDPQSPQSEDGAQATAKANNRYFNEGSYNTVWWETTVTPVIRLPQRKMFYGESPGDLLSDAQAGAAALGYFSSDYFSPFYVLCNSLPQYLFGGLSSGILNGSPGAISHELGHNFGLPHANFWQPETTVPGPVQPPNPPTAPYPIEPDSLIGHNDINAPFILRSGVQPSQEYGNPHDVMGSGPGHFSAMFKTYMNWLPDHFVHTITHSTTNRIYAFDTPHISEGREYAMRMRKDVQREYWFSYRQGFPDNPWFSSGLEVDWNFVTTPNPVGVLLTLGNNVLIDTTPDTSFGKQDAALVIGRTMHDPQASLHVTPIAQGGGPDPSDKWMDVVVQIGPFPDNQIPTLTLGASALTIPLGGTVNFTATAQDPDGDQLAYNWDFGDYTFGANSPVQSKAFLVDGQYVVRCEVSDMKGGVASAQVVVLVGTPSTFTISGRVLDTDGNPVQGVRVHNSGVKPANPAPAPDGINTNSAITDLGTYRYGYTDTDGYYVIGNVPPGTYTNRAYIYGYSTEPLDFTDPVNLNNGNAYNLNFTATKFARVSLARTADAFEPDDTGPGDGIFTLTREGGDFSQDLFVNFRLSGTALVDADYTLFPADTLTTNCVVVTNAGVKMTNCVTVMTNRGQIVIPAFQSSVDVHVIPIDNLVGDGDKTVVMTLLLQTNAFRVMTVVTNILTTNGAVVITNSMFVNRTNQISIPGWELRPSGPAGDPTWFQTDPTYVLGQAEATVVITDDDAPNVPTVSITVLDSDALESRGDSATLLISRANAPIIDALTVAYSLRGDAVNGEDYVRLPGTVTIPAGQDFVLLSVTAINDLFVEGNEIVTITIVPDPNGFYTGGGSAQVIIVDDDLPLVNIFAATATVGRTGGGSARVTISRAGNLDENLVVNYLVAGTAVSGVDFGTLPGSVTIPAGQLSVDVNITPIAGSTNKLPRTVTVVLSDATTYNIFNQNSATITIFDSTLPTVTFSRTADTISEAGGTAAFVVTRTGPTTNSLNVFFDVGGSAWEGSDYASIGTNVVIPAGALTANINITAINDPAREFGDTVGQDSVILQLRPGTNYNLGNTISGTMRITDDDPVPSLPSVGFMLRTSSVPEDAFLTYLYVKVTANPETNKPIQIEYRVTGGSAVPDVNYINLFPRGAGLNTAFTPTGILDIIHYTPPKPPPMFFAFEDGVYAIPVFILDDNVAGGDKTLTITLFNPTGYVTNRSLATNAGIIYTNVLITHIPTNAFIGPSSTHTITIQDLKTSTVTVGVSALRAYEAGPVPAQFILTRDGVTTAPLTVTFTVTGTAASGNDYVKMGTNGTVTFPAGSNTVAVTLLPIDDPTEETAESVIFTVLPKTGYHVGNPNSATIILVSDDGTIQFNSPSFDVGENAGPALIPVTRSGGFNLTTLVDYRFVGGTASNGVDYLGTNGTLTFLPGDTTKYISIPIIDDPLVEPDETISLVLTNPTGGVQLGGQKSATVNIINDDTAFDFTRASFRANENDLAGEVMIVRSGILTNTDRVFFSVTNGTAGANDFFADGYYVTFLPGETNHSVQVQITDDDLFEGDETVNLSLSSPSAPTHLGVLTNAVLIIVDDECQLEFEVAGYSVIEYSNYVTLVVRRVGGTVNPLSVSYATSNGTATNDLDYTAVADVLYFTGDHFETDTNGSGAVFFVPGERTRTITVPILDDTLGEGDETFFVTLSGPQDESFNSFPNSTLLGTNVTATVTILDNETAGNVDYEFNPGAGANGIVRSVSVAPRGGLVDFLGRVVVGGDFTTVDGLALNHIARLLPSGALDGAFNPGAGANSNVWAVAAQPDGKVLAGGEFTRMNNTNRPHLARLNADGTLDLGFDLGSNGVNGLVRAIALQNDGQVIIAGDFTQVSGVPRERIARLQTNGVLDPNFTATVNGNVHALAIQPDGRIVIGGAFTTVGGAGRVYLARLNTNGTLDASLVIGTGFNGPLNAVALQSDGKILAGGAFSNYNGTAIVNLARLSATGAYDVSFKSGTGPDATVHSIAFANAGKIVIGGAFTHYNASPRNYFARLAPGGSLDTAFRIGTGADAAVRAVVAQEDSAIVIGGDFTMVGGLPRNHVARVHGDEKLDLTGVQFVAGIYSIPEDGVQITITVARTGNTNRAFTVNFRTADISATAPQDYAATNGTLSFAEGELTKTFDVRVFDDALLEGNETVSLILENVSPVTIDLTGLTSAELVIVDTAKSVAFSTAAYIVGEGATNAVITLLRSGSLAGSVTITLSTVDDTARSGFDFTGFTNTITFTNGESSHAVLVPIINDGAPEFTETLQLRLSPPGSALVGNLSNAVLTIVDDDPGPGFADTTFNPGAGAGRFVRALALQPDGRLLVGGAFTNFASSNLNYIARLETNGAVDPAFNPGSGPNALVSGIGLAADGHISLGGAFSNYNGGVFNHLVRVGTNGAADSAFSAPLLFDAALNGVAVQADGRMVVGGAFKSPAAGVARVRVNGTLDLQFDPGAGADAAVNAVALQPDGKVLIGGAFTNVAGFARPRVARLGADGTLDGTFASLGITNGNVFAVGLAPGGKILIGGSFRYVNGLARSGVARLNADGALDLSFNPGTGVTGTVYTVCALTNGSVFIGGDFTTVDGTNRNRYALMRKDGSLSVAFDSRLGADSTVFASLVTPDQKIVIGGDFSTVAGVSRKGVARLNVTTDPTAALLTGLRVMGGAAQITVTTTPNFRYVLEGSSDLRYWLPLSTNLASGATLNLTDSSSSGGQRFYRVRVEE